MREVRLSTVIIVTLIVGSVSFVLLAFFGQISVGPFNKENLRGLFVKTTATARGFTPAKSPKEAMEKFQEAIERREYNYAAVYCTKPYADMLLNAHDNARDLALIVDKFRKWGDNKTLLSDKLIVAFYQIDPFPSNFRVKSTSNEVTGKAIGEFDWFIPEIKTSRMNVTILDELKDMDPRMFTNVLAFKMFIGKMNLVKEGEDWKIDVPVNPLWQAEVHYFNERAKRYTNRLTSFWGDINNQRYSDQAVLFQNDIFMRFKEAK